MLTSRIKKELGQLGRGGIWTTNTVNDGSTYIGVLGVEGVGGGVPSPSSEILARQCATNSRGSDRAAGA